MAHPVGDAALALEQLAARIRCEADEQVAELQRVANGLRSFLGLPSVGQPSLVATPIVLSTTEETAQSNSASSRVRPGQFRGMKPTTALEVYMRARREDGHIPIANVLVDLLAGGLDMGDRGDYWERRLMAIARERPKVFGYDPERKEIWLAPTAYETPRPKPRGMGQKFGS